MTPDPWERQPGDTTKSWHAFTIYRDLGPTRSYGKTSETLGKPASYTRQIQMWGSRNNWIERCKQWDVEKDRIARETRIEQLRAGIPSMQERQVEASVRDQTALDIIARTFIERFERADPELLGQLNELPAPELVKLVALAARARKIAVQVEWAARGVSASALGGDDGDVGEERALDQFLERIRQTQATEDSE